MKYYFCFFFFVSPPVERENKEKKDEEKQGEEIERTQVDSVEIERRMCKLIPREGLALIMLVWLISLLAALWPPRPFSLWTENYASQQCLSIELVWQINS